MKLSLRRIMPLILFALLVVSCKSDEESTLPPTIPEKTATAKPEDSIPTSENPVTTNTPIVIPILPQTTASPTLPSLPVDLPYNHDNGGLPSGAVDRIGIGHIRDVLLYPEHDRIFVFAQSGFYAYQLPGYELIWRHDVAREVIFTEFNGQFLPKSERFIHKFQELGSYYGTVILYNAANGEKIREFPQRRSSDIYPSPDEGLFAMQEDFYTYPEYYQDKDMPLPDVTVRLYDSVSGDIVRTLTFPYFDYTQESSSLDRSSGVLALNSGPRGYYFGNMAWSPDGRILVGCGDGYVVGWDTTSSDLLFALPNNSASSRWCDIQFPPSGQYVSLRSFDEKGSIVIAFDDPQIIWESYQATPQLWTEEHFYFSKKSEHYRLSVDTWEEELIISADGYLIPSPDGQRFGLNDVLFQIFDSNTFEEAYKIDIGPKEDRRAFCRWSPEGTGLACRNSDKLYIFDGITGKPLSSWFIPYFIDPYHVGDLFFINEDKALFYDAYRILEMRADTGEVLEGMWFNLPLEDIAWSEDGETLFLYAKDDTWYWSSRSQQVRDRPPSGNAQVFPNTEGWYGEYTSSDEFISLLSPNGQYESIRGECSQQDVADKVLQITDKDGHLILERDYEELDIMAMAWSADSRYFAVGIGCASRHYISTLTNSQIIVFDMQTGEEAFTFMGQLGWVRRFAFSPDGSRLASLAGDGTVVIWDTSD